MSTQCGIAIKTEKGYDTIYVQSDGYPEYMWPMLTENYNSEELAAELVSMGDASCINKNIGPASEQSRLHSNQHNNDACVFYHRDFHDTWWDAAPACYDKAELVNYHYYTYIWEDGSWHFYRGGRKVY